MRSASISRVVSILVIAIAADNDLKSTFAFVLKSKLTIQQRHESNIVNEIMSSSTALYYHPDQPPIIHGDSNNLMSNEYYELDLEMATHELSRAYDRGVECATNFGMCDIDEMLDLSEELDGYLDCYIGSSPHDCQAEVDDRQDLAEALLVQAEMREDHDQHSYMQEVEEGYQYDTMNGNVGGESAAENGRTNVVNDSLPRTSVWRNSNEQFIWGDDSSMGV